MPNHPARSWPAASLCHSVRLHRANGTCSTPSPRDSITRRSQDFFGFRNFRQFERTRREIKLPYDLLNNLVFRRLPDAYKAHLICLLLLSARMDNLLPNNSAKLEQLIGATEPLDLYAFADFIEFG